jgi:excisionase family DNA binding protein
MGRFTTADDSGATVERLLSDVEAAEVIGVSVSTLASWRCRGTYNLPFFKVGRLVRYSLRDIEAWLESRRRDMK